MKTIFYNNEIFNSNMLDVFDNINVDVAIADSNTLTYNLFTIPKKSADCFQRVTRNEQI